MTDTQRAEPGHEDFERWSLGYHERGEVIAQAVGQIIFECMDEATGDPSEVRRRVRTRRASVGRRFCLLLYASSTDEELFSQYRDGMTDEEFEEAIALASAPQRNSKALTLLMLLLDHQADTHLLMLERPNDEAPDGPVRLRVPDNIWFESFTLVAELARAIIVIGNLGPNLLREVRYLADAGLAGRMLIYGESSVFTREEGKPPEELKSWPLPNGLKEAVEYAAAQTAD